MPTWCQSYVWGLNAKGIASDSENEVAMTTGLFT